MAHGSTAARENSAVLPASTAEQGTAVGIFRAAALAPALAIAAVVFFGLILGRLGVVFAHPLTICARVLVKELCAEPQMPVP